MGKKCLHCIPLSDEPKKRVEQLEKILVDFVAIIREQYTTHAELKEQLEIHLKEKKEDKIKFYNFRDFINEVLRLNDVAIDEVKDLDFIPFLSQFQEYTKELEIEIYLKEKKEDKMTKYLICCLNQQTKTEIVVKTYENKEEAERILNQCLAAKPELGFYMRIEGEEAPEDLEAKALIDSFFLEGNPEEANINNINEQEATHSLDPNNSIAEMLNTELPEAEAIKPAMETNLPDEWTTQDVKTPPKKKRTTKADEIEILKNKLDRIKKILEE